MCNKHCTAAFKKHVLPRLSSPVECTRLGIQTEGEVVVGCGGVTHAPEYPTNASGSCGVCGARSLKDDAEGG